MGKKGRMHKEAVTNGDEQPFRASPDKPKTEPIVAKKEEPVKPAKIVVVADGDVVVGNDSTKAESLLERAKRLSGH